VSTYNLIRADLQCPHCGVNNTIEAEAFFGFGDLIDYAIGDLVRWVPRAAPQNGGRPSDGTMTGEGYAVCPGCGRDFFIDVAVVADRIQSLTVNRTKHGYIPG
jgi:hypothetical protein